MGKFRDARFVLQKSTNFQNKHFGVQETCTEWCEAVDVWSAVSFPTFFAQTYEVNTLQKERKHARF